MPTTFTPYLLLFTAAVFTACVPARQYEEMNDRYTSMQTELAAATATTRAATTAKEELDVKYADLQRDAKQMAQDTAMMGTGMRRMQRQYDKMNELNEDLLEKYNMLLSGETSENRKLLTDLEASRLRLMAKEDSVDMLAESLAEREAKLAELRAELEKKDAAMKALRSRISTALTGFEGKGLTVEQKYGRIYVSLENKLLFPSGSTVVDKAGKEALVSLAKAIENEKDLNILVEGHTDTDKILPGSPYKDNWDLSVMRATSVVRILQENSRLEPLRITAGGRGEYLPLDPNDKAKNRRIEIVLAPDLKPLYEMVTD